MAIYQGEGDARFGAQVQVLLRMLDDLPPHARTSTALAAASSLIEYAAYEMAQSDEARHVARLILLAADMERTADELRARGSSPH